MSNHWFIAGLGIVGLGLVSASGADTQLLARKDLSLATVLAIATTGAEMCKGRATPSR